MLRVEGITTAERRATYRRRSVVQLTTGYPSPRAILRLPSIWYLILGTW